MLVLSRQRDETIMIGDDVEITVVSIRGDKVRLGITAPLNVQVHRKEVYDAIKHEEELETSLVTLHREGKPHTFNPDACRSCGESSCKCEDR